LPAEALEFQVGLLLTVVALHSSLVG
jgi:hypothetical protein